MENQGIACPQCGGVFPIREEGPFTTCPFCGSNLHLGSEQAIAHEIVLPTIPADELPGRLGRWLTAREVTALPADVSARLVWFPFWTVPDGTVFPAAPILASNLATFRLPAGDRKAFAEEFTRSGEVTQATVLGDSLAVPDSSRASLRLIHLPFHEVRFRIFRHDFRVWFDAASGQPITFELPPASEKRLDLTYAVLLGALFCVVFWATKSVFGYGRAPLLGLAVLAAGGPLFWLVVKRAMSLSEGE
jgi:hypothetical protein